MLRRNTRLIPVFFATVLAFSRCPRPAVHTVVWPRADIVVAPDSTGTYHSISEALGSASDGSVILVKPGVYREQVKIDRVGRLTLISIDPANTIIDATDKYAAVEMRTDSNRLSGFTLRNADSHGVWVRDGHQAIDHCLIVNNGDRGIYLSALAGNASALIDHCTVADNGESGIYAARDSSGTVITNCIIARNPRGIVTDRNAGNMTIDYNCVSNQSVDFDRVTPGAHNITKDPQFIDAEHDDYRLKRGSPGIRTAQDGTNPGCF
jgi:hypothetical protein